MIVRFGSPALLVERAERARFLQLGDQPGDRILGAVDPCVVVVAANDPLVGLGRAGELRDHVVERLEPPVGLHVEMDACGPGAESIGDRQGRRATTPGATRTAERGEQRLRVAVRDRQHRDLRDRLRIA